jgi:PAS domain S-box-containing protein
MNPIIRILHLEDLPEDAELVENELHKANIKFEKQVVDNKEDYEKMLCNFNPDIILSDHSLPSFDSFHALAALKETKLDIPFILVTATMSEEFAVDIMKQGASDYILKDRLQRLPSAIINSIEKHRLEKDERAGNERLLFHIENTPLGFIEWDDQLHIQSLSKRAEEILGWSEQDFIKNEKTGDSRVGKNDLPRASKIVEQLLKGELVRNKVQNRNTTKDGRVIWCEWFNSILTDKNGKIKTVMSLVQDITEQKQLERQKDNFLAIVSHELNTPLTTIKAYGQLAEIMLETNGDTETLLIVKRMSSQVNKLTGLVQDLLDFTKTQKGKLMYNEVFFDFNELLKEVIDDMQKINVTHKIENNAGPPETIFGDKNKLSQVLNNLISNAIKYSPKATSIIVSTKRLNDGIELTVQDFGIGILDQDQKNVFDQFYRVNRDSQSTFPGMGIGLYISAEIITSQGGKIWVESVIDKGSTFHAWLPFDHRNKTSRRSPKSENLSRK